MTTLQFAPWSSDIDLSFYAALASRKVNHDKLDDAARQIVGRYELRPGDAPEQSARMHIPGDSFKTDKCVYPKLCRYAVRLTSHPTVSYRANTEPKGS